MVFLKDLIVSVVKVLFPVSDSSEFQVEQYTLFSATKVLARMTKVVYLFSLR